MHSLFYKIGCPYCEKVLQFAEENDIQLDLLDIGEAETYDMLIQYGGKQQVPFLYDEEEKIAMYESDDIINHLKAHL